MLLRRLLGIFVLSVAVVLPVAGQDKEVKDKAKTDTPEVKKDTPKVEEKKETPKTAEPKSGDKALLKWKFEAGKDFYQKMTTTTTQVMKVQNNEVKQIQEQTFFFKWSVTEVKGNDVTLKQKIEGVQMKIDIGNQKIEYDSTNEKTATANNPLADFFKSLKDSEFVITLNAETMAVTKIDGRGAFVDKLGKQNPQMKQLLETILSDNALKQMAEPTFAAIPGAEEAVGASWEKKTSLDMGPIGKYDNAYKYTYKGKDKKSPKLDEISVETTLKYTPPVDAAAGSSGLPFKIKSADLKSTKAEGTILFSADKGRIESSNMKLKLNGKLSIEIGGQTTEVDLDQDQNSNVENTDASQLPKTTDKK